MRNAKSMCHVGISSAILAGLLTLTAGYSAWAKADTNEVLSIPSVTEQINECHKMVDGRRDNCLARLALIHSDPGICARTPASRCAEIAGAYLMQQCNNSAAEERLSCEVGVAIAFPEIKLCDSARYRSGCVSSVASTLRDPSLIAEHITDPRARDMALATYAANVRDERALDLIEDNEIYDNALVFIVSSIGFGNDTWIDPAAYCGQLRGKYTSDYPEDAEMNAELCLMAVTISNTLLGIGEGENGERQMDAVAARIPGLMDALDRGDIDVENIGSWLSGDGARTPPLDAVNTPDSKQVAEEAADEHCDSYAWSALTQQRENEKRQCKFSGPAWRDDYDHHYDWCLKVDVTESTKGTKYRADALRDVCKGATREHCDAYANSALAQQRQNLSRRCGFGGPAWRDDFDHHYDWCLDADIAVSTKGTKDRSDALQNNCKAAQ